MLRADERNANRAPADVVDAAELVDHQVADGRIDRDRGRRTCSRTARDRGAGEAMRQQAELWAEALTSGCRPRLTHATAGHNSPSARTRSGSLIAHLDRHPATHRVANHVGAADLELVHQPEHQLREPARVVATAGRLGGGAEAGQVGRVDAVALAERRRRLNNDARVPPRPCRSSTSGPCPIVSVEIRWRPTGTSRIWSNGGRPPGSRNMPSNPIA